MCLCLYALYAWVCMACVHTDIRMCMYLYVSVAHTCILTNLCQ